MSLNKTMLIGRLGADPEIRHTQNGDPVANLSLATSEKWKDKSGESNEKTEWHRIVAFGKLAELCRDYLSKGRQVYVEGKLQTRKWEDKDGNDRYTTEVVAREVVFLGSRDDQASKPRDRHPPPDDDFAEDVDDAYPF